MQGRTKVKVSVSAAGSDPASDKLPTTAECFNVPQTGYQLFCIVLNKILVSPVFTQQIMITQKNQIIRKQTKNKHQIPKSRADLFIYQED